MLHNFAPNIQILASAPSKPVWHVDNLCKPTSSLHGNSNAGQRLCSLYILGTADSLQYWRCHHLRLVLSGSLNVQAIFHTISECFYFVAFEGNWCDKRMDGRFLIEGTLPMNVADRSLSVQTKHSDSAAVPNLAPAPSPLVTMIPSSNLSPVHMRAG